MINIDLKGHYLPNCNIPTKIETFINNNIMVMNNFRARAKAIVNAHKDYFEELETNIVNDRFFYNWISFRYKQNIG